MSDGKDADVIVVGGGPAGIAAAVALRRRGVKHVVLLERDEELGGVPRHCGHPPFGMREFGRLLTGPQYAKRLAELAAREGVDVRVRTTVVKLEPQASVQVSSPLGRECLRARRVILSTGVRETPRSARLTSGDRPMGVLNTGALQAYVYLRGLIPFRRPLIVGTELVSLSALLTCGKAGIHPVAMIESRARPTASRALALYPGLRGIPVHYGTELEQIHGVERVESVSLRNREGVASELACDGVLFTGRFLPESALIRGSHLLLDAGSTGPDIDQYGRCSDMTYYAAGNLLRAVETAGWSYREGMRIGGLAADDLSRVAGPAMREVRVGRAGPVKLVVPQRLSLPLAASSLRHIQVRFDREARGRLTVRAAGVEIWSRKMVALPERRVLIPIDELKLPEQVDTLIVGFGD
jgi:NADPH-dependent 2,4-dienoyl-CoA reductase/sulfur reductase-like enzyme